MKYPKSITDSNPSLGNKQQAWSQASHSNDSSDNINTSRWTTNKVD